MNSKTVLIIRHFISFAETLLRVSADTDPSGSRSFLNALQQYNEDTSISDSRPFFFVPTTEDKLTVDRHIIMGILEEADKAGIADQFKNNSNRMGEMILFFSHAARPFASQMASLFSLSIVNIGANGLSLDSFSSQGLFTIREKELNEDLAVAKILIQ